MLGSTIGGVEERTMVNGSGPPILANADYQAIKLGVCVTGGDYDGCIKVGSVHYWLEKGHSYWILRDEDVDDQLIVKMTDSIWDKCKDGGVLDWSTRGEYWFDKTKDYRWDGPAGGDIELVEI
jgi:hypothetical protein